MTSPAIVRFAPSPTGYLHIGGARTAIFNWLFARKTGGRFILRIEDTDAERSTAESIDGILDGMRWLGLDWDDEPYFQSRFRQDHVDASRQLLETGHAYRCFCTKDELDAQRETARAAKATYRYDGRCRRLSAEEAGRMADRGMAFTVRLKVPRPPGKVQFSDAVYGDIEKAYADIEDFIIVRSNGEPLYILANAVDDIRDGVTHVIRGADGLANTPKQVLIYEALGASLPVFAHMSLTLDPQKAKISKRRHGEQVSVQYYRDIGFLPWAFVNFLVLLGWSTSDAREYFTQSELIEAFSLKGIGKANAVFDPSPADVRFITDPKALNMNAHYLRSMDLEVLAPLVAGRLGEADMWDPSFDGDRRAWFLEVVELIRERFHLLSDFATQGQAYFSDTVAMDPVAVEKHLRKPEGLAPVLLAVADGMDALDVCEASQVEAMLKTVIGDTGIKAGVLVNAIRTAVTGSGKGPDFLKVLVALGPERVGGRLREAAASIS